MGGIKIYPSKSAKCPHGHTLAGKIAEYLFEEEYGELKNLTESEVKTLRRAMRILQK